MDKLTRQGKGVHGTRDASGEGIQQALLKRVEGAQVRLSIKGKKDAGNANIID